MFDFISKLSKISLVFFFQIAALIGAGAFVLDALQRLVLLCINAPDKIINDHDPVVCLQHYLDAHPEWKHADAHVYWNQDGWKQLAKKDYMVSSIQVSFPLISL